jgi:hypothetical protein
MIRKSDRKRPEEVGSTQTKPWIIYERSPDRLEYVIRAVCGGLLGVFLSLTLWQVWRYWDLGYVILGFICLCGFCAWQACRRGDAFWGKVGEFMRWN